MFTLIERIVKNPVTTIGGLAVTLLSYAVDQSNAFTWHGLINDLPFILGMFSKDR